MVRKIKLLFLRFLFAFAKPLPAARIKIEEAMVQLAWSIRLSDAKAEKLSAYEAWSKPENIAARRKIEEEEAPKALEAGLKLKAMIRELQGLPLEDPPLPEEATLPLWMRAQSESMVRAYLRHKQMGLIEE